MRLPLGVKARMMGLVVLMLGCLAVSSANEALAVPEKTSERLVQCMARAETWPDQTAAYAHAWLKNGGGDQALTCQASAQFHRGEFASASRSFAALAAKNERVDRKKALKLHVQAALAAMRANDYTTSESEFAAALEIEPQDPDIWMDRATGRAVAQRYWDALSDANKALALMPDLPSALRLRGQIREKLGQDINAMADFERAAMIDEAEKEAERHTMK
jgi:tetratricopeptide (TPR) repeat protein